MKIEPKQAKIGMWYAPCCLHDLYQITSQDDLEWIASNEEDQPEEGKLDIRVWDNLEEALSELTESEDKEDVRGWLDWRRTKIPQDQQEIESIVARLGVT